MKKGDVYRHYEGNFIRITDIRKIGSDDRVYFEGPRGTRNNLSERQFLNPIDADGGKITRYRLANRDPENPWLKK